MPSFLDLPLSAREKTYRYALVRKRIFIRPFVSMTYIKDPDRKYNHHVPTIRLLYTSKQIYKEAMPIYLTENTFSIVQADLLAAARMEYPRVFQSLKLIRRIEVIFDARDYIYLARFVASDLPRIRAEIEASAPSSRHKRAALERLDDMHSRFDLDGIPTTDQPSRIVSVEEGQETHDRHIENMKEYLWGRTMTFVRQTFRLSHLYVDMRRCTCVNGCCRLADEVMTWGSLYVWVHGTPDEMEIRGVSEREMGVIASTFDKQRFHRRLEREEIYDMERVENRQGFRRYNDMLKVVYQRIAEENLYGTGI